MNQKNASSLKCNRLVKIAMLYFLVANYNSYSQEVHGEVTDNDKKLNGVKINNLSNSNVSYSDNNGDFVIKAKVNDSLIFQLISFKDVKIKIDSLKLNHSFQVLMTEKVNFLDEVVITSYKFDLQKFNSDFNNQLQTDIAINSYLYEPQSDGRVDLIKASNYLGEKFMELFNIKRNKLNIENPEFITFDDLDSLFNQSEFFNNDLLVSKINIDLKNKNLFYFYCEDKKMNVDLLKKDNSFFLLDKLIKNAQEFRDHLNN